MATNHPDEQELLKALAHPMRSALLELCLEAAGARSPKELSGFTDQPLPHVSYHVRVLADCGAVEVVAEKPVRGSVEHFYRATPLVKKTRWVHAALGLTASD
jgi:DNA-binding transcriptional ArsR family regulator